MLDGMRRPVRLGWLFSTVVAGIGATLASAGGPPHEFIPLPGRAAAGGDRNSAKGAKDAGAARHGGNEPVYTPAGDEAVVASGASGPPRPGDPPPERRDRVVPDRDTGSEPPGTHVYHEVFNPSVAPWKRMTALDAVSQT